MGHALDDACVNTRNALYGLIFEAFSRSGPAERVYNCRIAFQQVWASVAILDPRLLPLIEVLAETGLDWLAFELVEGAGRGEEPIEDGFALRRARARARRTSDAGEYTEPLAPSGGAATPLLGLDQLEWAARFVDERLTAALDQMARSLDALDDIVAGVEDRSSDSAVATKLVLRDDDRVEIIGRADVEGALARLSALREALESWLLNERSDPRQ